MKFSSLQFLALLCLFSLPIIGQETTHAPTSQRPLASSHTFVPNCLPNPPTPNPPRPQFAQFVNPVVDGQVTSNDCMGHWVGKQEKSSNCEYAFFTAKHCSDGNFEKLVVGRFLFQKEQNQIRVDSAKESDAAIVYATGPCDLIPNDQIGTLASTNSEGKVNIESENEVLRLQTRSNGVLQAKPGPKNINFASQFPGVFDIMGAELVSGSKLSQEGDSGSPVWNERNEIVGAHHTKSFFRKRPFINFSAKGVPWATEKLKAWCGSETSSESRTVATLQSPFNQNQTSPPPSVPKASQELPGEALAKYQNIRKLNNSVLGKKEDGTWDKVHWINGAFVAENGGNFTPDSLNELLTAYEKTKAPENTYGGRAGMVYNILSRNNRSVSNFSANPNNNLPGTAIGKYENIRGNSGTVLGKKADGTWAKVHWVNGGFVPEGGGQFTQNTLNDLLTAYERTKTPESYYGGKADMVRNMLSRNNRSVANFKTEPDPRVPSQLTPERPTQIRRKPSAIDIETQQPSAENHDTLPIELGWKLAPSHGPEFRSNYPMPKAVKSLNTEDKFEYLMNEDAKRRQACTQHRTFVPREIAPTRPGQKITTPSLVGAIGKCISCHSSGSGRSLILPRDPSGALWALREAVRDKTSPVNFESIYKMATNSEFAALSKEELTNLFGFLIGKNDEPLDELIQMAVQADVGRSSGNNQQVAEVNGNAYRNLIKNSTDNPFINAVIADSDTFYFDKNAMPFEYQVAADSTGLGEGRDYTTSSRSRDFNTILDSNGNFMGILGKALGISPNNPTYDTFTFMRLPHDIRGNQIPIGFGSMAYTANQANYRNGKYHPTYLDYWDFPIGTVFGEVIHAKDPSGRSYVSEIRTRRRMPGGSWQPDVYRRFPTSDDLVRRVQEVFPNWKEDKQLSNLVSTIERKERLKNSVVRDNYYTKVIEASGAVDELPPLSADKVQKLIQSTPLRSSLGKVWDQNGENISYAPTSRQAYHVSPALKDVHAVATSTESCTRCHDKTGLSVGLLKPNEINSMTTNQQPENYLSTWTANACPDGAPSFSPYRLDTSGKLFNMSHTKDGRRVGGSADFRPEFLKSGILTPLRNQLSDFSRAKYYQ